MYKRQILHWLGEAFDPQLKGYWGEAEADKAMSVVLHLIADNRTRIDGIKISLLDKEKEIEMRRRLPAGVRMYTCLLYTSSEQIGVSPWSWWADVRIPRQDALFVDPGRHIQPVPAVKYRGIFLNDEAPALTGWVNEKFGGYNSKFYVHVFELLLRLKANYLWPAMWNSAFAADDPLNAKLADEYGIVMRCV